jgi:hypothetical protein
MRTELGDISHPFMIEIVGDGVRTHFRLEHRPLDLESVVVTLVDPGFIPPEIPDDPDECPPNPCPTVLVGVFSTQFSPQFDVLRLQIEDTGAELPLPEARVHRASGKTRADWDNGKDVFQIAVGIYIESTAGQVVFDEPPRAGAIYRIEGRKWRYFDTPDMCKFLNTAISMHSHNRANSAGGAFSIADMDPVEEYPLALLGTIQALWALATDASFDIDIMAPDGVNIPRSERFRQLMEMIGARQTQYDEMAQALNIGISRLETYTVRRTAKLTNRLVPVYLSREFDDWSTPKRVILDQNLLGTSPVKTMVGAYDIDLYSGYPWELVIDIGCDLAREEEVYTTTTWWESPFACDFTREFDGVERMSKTKERRVVTAWTPEAGIRRARGAPWGAPLRKITCEVMDERAGLVKLSLTAQETRRLPYNAFWELQLRPDDGGDGLPVLAGMIRASITEVVL